jgi:hypothetical protein
MIDTQTLGPFHWTPMFMALSIGGPFVRAWSFATRMVLKRKIYHQPTARETHRRRGKWRPISEFGVTPSSTTVIGLRGSGQKFGASGFASTPMLSAPDACLCQKAAASGASVRLFSRVVALASLRRLWAVQTMAHSPLTLSRPPIRN